MQLRVANLDNLSSLGCVRSADAQRTESNGIEPKGDRSNFSQ